MIRLLRALVGAKKKDAPSVQVIAPDYSRATVRPRTPGRLRGRGGF